MSADSPDPEVKALDRKIQSITDVLARGDVSENDKASLALLLEEAKEEKRQRADNYLESILSRYRPGGKTSKPKPKLSTLKEEKEEEEPIVVDDSDDNSQTAKKPSALSLKGKKKEKLTQVVEEKSKPLSKKVTKTKKTIPKVTVEDSPVPGTPQSSAPTPRGRKRKKAPAASTDPPTTKAVESPAVKKSTVKKVSKIDGRPRRSDVVWCSSDTEDGDPSGVPFTHEEHKAMYDAAREDVEAYKNSFKDEITKEKKNERRKALFKKIKESVNSVGGNRRRKKYLYIHSQDHKSTSRSAHKELVKKYGASGAAAMPKNEGLNPSQIMCLEFWGIECSGFVAGARQTKLDPDSTSAEDETVGSSDDAREMAACEREQKRLKAAPEDADTPDKSKGKTSLKGRKGSNTIEVPEPTQEEVDRMKKRLPARKVRSKKSRDVLTNSEDDVQKGEGEEPDGESPLPKLRRSSRVKVTPAGSEARTPDSSTGEVTPAQQPTRSSERIRAKKECISSSKKTISQTLEDLSWGTSSRRHLSYNSGDEGAGQDSASALPDISMSSMDDAFDQPLDYSVHVQSPTKDVRVDVDLGDVLTPKDDRKKVPKASTPKDGDSDDAVMVEDEPKKKMKHTKPKTKKISESVEPVVVVDEATKKKTAKPSSEKDTDNADHVVVVDEPKKKKVPTATLR